jgi:hypothetical protein
MRATLALVELHGVVAQAKQLLMLLLLMAVAQALAGREWIELIAREWIEIGQFESYSSGKTHLRTPPFSSCGRQVCSAAA